MFTLTDIGETVQRVADAIAAVLNVDVEIVDSGLLRVAGTGAARERIGKRMDYGVINRIVQRTQQPIVVPEPGKHEYCRECPLIANCHYFAQIIYPILYQGRSIGSISLISFTKEQEETLLLNTERLMVFLSRMAEMISSKIGENILLDKLQVTSSELQAVVDSVGQGIIAVDRAGVITHINRRAVKLLQVESEEIIGRPIEDISSDAPVIQVIENRKGFADKEIRFSCSRGNICLIASSQPIIANDQVVGAVTILQDLKSVGKLINSLTGHSDFSLDKILGTSPLIMDLKNQVKRIAKSDSTVLVRGESGTGKELFARAIHAESNRNTSPFVAINCAAIPETLLESELFGFEEGSFTGAKKGGKVGKFELAQQGTLFLDEIGDMPLHLQVKLLRVLEDRRFERVGGVASVKLEARLITATNRDLEGMVKRGEFREDLYYRLNVIPFHVPSLRQRTEDISLLLDHFLAYYNAALNKSVLGFSREAALILLNYSWPGNVRELQNTVEYCTHMADTAFIEISHLPQRIFSPAATEGPQNHAIRSLDDMEKEMIVNALNFFGNSLEAKRSVAAALGIGLTTLYRKGKKYGLAEFSN